LVYLEHELEYLEAKLKFLIFMSEKKRAVDEVVSFLSSFRKEISRRLEAIPLTRLTNEEIINTKEEIKSCKSSITDKKVLIKTQKTKSIEIEKNNSSASRKSSRKTSLMGEIKEEYHEGIRIWNPEEQEENEEEQLETNIENE